MSLVSEALKKAEREAAARDARGQGAPEPFAAPLQPYRSRRGSSGRGSRTPLFAALGGAAALVALLLVWWSSGRKAPGNGGDSATSASAAAPPATAAAVPGPAAQPLTSPDPALPSASLAPTPPSAPTGATSSASEPRATTPATAHLPRTPLRTSSEPPSASEPAAPQASSARTAGAPARAQETITSFGPGDYLLRADLPDGTKLELGGIVYSEASPFAYLNGRLVGVGEFVEGHRIDRIERDKVLLSSDAGTVTLRLKRP